MMCGRWRAGREGTPMLKVVHDEAEPNEASGSVLDEIVREAARQMLAVALQAELSADIDAHAEEVDENGHRRVVRNGHLNAPHLVALVRAGAVFTNGRLIERPDESEGGDQQVARHADPLTHR